MVTKVYKSFQSTFSCITRGCMLGLAFISALEKLLVKLVSKSKLILAWISLGIYLLLGSISIVPGMVVCLEADGQISFEKSTNGFCSDFYETPTLKNVYSKATSALKALKCNNCKDVQLISDNNTLSTSTCRSPILLTTSHILSPSHITTFISFPLSSNSQFPHPPPLQLGPHKLLKTVKLLV